MRSLMIVILIFIIIFTLCISCSCGPEAPTTPGNKEETASESLEIFKRLVTRDNYDSLGFESFDELSRVELGEPLQYFLVHLKDLLGYQSGGDPNKILNGGDMWLYPVLVDGNARSSIELVKKDNRWKAVSFGYPNLTRLILNQQIQQSSRLKVSSDSFFIVRIPALDLVFIGHRVNKELFLTPVCSSRKFTLQVGETKPADEIFPVLVSIISYQTDWKEINIPFNITEVTP
jgi:hypothetical protein